MFAFIHSISTAVLDFAVAHSQWLAPLTFAFTFVKSLPFIAIIIPGTAILISIGALVGAGDAPFLPIWIAASIGAGLGDWVSYWLGRQYGPRISQSKPVQDRIELYIKAKKFIDRWGGVSIVLCRFFGPLRATVPLVAGILEMPRTVFHLTNWLSAFLWASALLVPGWIGVKLF
jgi:membrane protein DedA with SNARE-associated domain